MAGEMWKLCAVKIGTTTIGQIVEEEITDDLTELLAMDPASGYARAASVDLIDTRIRFTTEAVKTALGEIGLAGISLATSNAVAYFAKYDSGGGLGANACATFTLAKGIGLWRSMRAEKGSLANVSFELIGVSADGSTHPAEKATGVALPTITTEEMYDVAGSTGIQGIDLDTGIQETLIRGDDDIYYTDSAIGPCVPRCRYRQNTMGALGAVTNLSSVAIQDCTAGGGRGTSPITFTFNEMMGGPQRIGGNPTETEYLIIAAYDGTNAPIVITGLS